MLNRNEIEIPHERGRTMSLSEVLEEMFGFNPNAIDEERNGRHRRYRRMSFCLHGMISLALQGVNWLP